jgi:hypothetical protein
MHTDAQLVVGILQLQNRVYTQVGRGPSPRGSSRNSRHSALLPKARESDPTARGSDEINHKSLMAEDGRTELHRVSPRLTAYKAASAPNGLHLPYQKADALRRHRLKLVGLVVVDPTRSRVRAGCSTLSYRPTGLLLAMISPKCQKSTDG